MKEELRLELMLEAIKYCKKVKEMGMPASAYSKALREPIHFLWERRNGNKVVAAQYRSKKSLGFVFGNDIIRYDHAVPFKYVQEVLLSSNELTAIELKKILESHIVTCIITKEEHEHLSNLKLSSKMPEDWDGKDPLARYKEASIEVVPNTSQKV